MLHSIHSNPSNPMRNLLILSLLLSMIAGIASCTEKEDPIQTVKDRLVGTWVEKSPCRWGCDTMTFTRENTVIMPFNYLPSSLNRPVYNYTFIEADSMHFFASNGDKRWSAFRFNSSNEVHFYTLQQHPFRWDVYPITLTKQ